MSTLDLRAASDESPTSAWFMARGRVLLVEGGWRNQQLSPGSEGASWPRRRHHQKVPRGLGDGIIRRCLVASATASSLRCARASTPVPESPPSICGRSCITTACLPSRSVPSALRAPSLLGFRASIKPRRNTTVARTRGHTPLPMIPPNSRRSSTHIQARCVGHQLPNSSSWYVETSQPHLLSSGALFFITPRHVREISRVS